MEGEWSWGMCLGSTVGGDGDTLAAGVRTVAADFEDVGGPEEGVGEVVAGDCDDVVQVVVLVFDWVDVSDRRVRGWWAGTYCPNV